MIKLAHCAAYPGLASDEALGRMTPSAKHRRLLSSYLLNLNHGATAVHDMIVRDIRCFLDLGAKSRAADLRVALRLFLADFPEALSVHPNKSAAGVVPPPSKERCRYESAPSQGASQHRSPRSMQMLLQRSHSI